MKANNFERNFQSHDRYLRAFALKLTRDTQAAEDLFQDTAFRAFKHQDKFSKDSNLRAWLTTIMKNIYINNFRKIRRRGQILDHSKEQFLLNSDSSVRNEGEGTLTLEELSQLIEELEDSLKKPFLLAYAGYKYQEIGEQLELPIGTVKSRIFLARKALKHRIKKLYAGQSLVEIAA